MSVWRQKALQIAPELKTDFQDPALSLYTVLSEFIRLLKEAHQGNDQKKIEQIYNYAEWCFRQTDKTLWNAAGVSFYEHLAEDEHVFSQVAKWLKRDIYIKIRGLLLLNTSDERIRILDRQYGITPETLNDEC